MADKKKTDILAIGAHAGDVEIASGMALAHHIKLGRQVSICHMTLGEMDHPKKSASDYAKQKRDEAMAAADAIGADVYFLPYNDGELTTTDDIKMALCDVIRECRPSIILTHWKHSVNKDHSACHTCVSEAIIYAGIDAFERMLPAHQVNTVYYAETWEDYEDFAPEMYIEVGEDDILAWEKMVRKYAIFRGELTKFPYVDYYKSLSKVRGTEVYAQNATAFGVPASAKRQLVKPIAQPLSQTK